MNNPMFALKGPKMQHGEKGYATNFPLEHAQKDVRFAQALGDEQGVPLSVASAANGMLQVHFLRQCVQHYIFRRRLTTRLSYMN